MFALGTNCEETLERLLAMNGWLGDDAQSILALATDVYLSPQRVCLVSDRYRASCSGKTILIEEFTIEGRTWTPVGSFTTDDISTLAPARVHWQFDRLDERLLDGTPRVDGEQWKSAIERKAQTQEDAAEVVEFALDLLKTFPDDDDDDDGNGVTVTSVTGDDV